MLGLAAAFIEHLSQAPWLAKDVVWLMPDARCGLLPSVEVSGLVLKLQVTRDMAESRL